MKKIKNANKASGLSMSLNKRFSQNIVKTSKILKPASKSRRVIYLLVLGIISVFAITGVNFSTNSKASAKAKIVWSEPVLNLSIPRGGGEVRQELFVSSGNLQNIRIEAVPEIAGFITIQPNLITNVTANQPQQVSLFFSVPAETQLGRREGTIHIKSGNSTIPQTLKVNLNIVDGELNLPDPDQIGSPGKVTLSGVSEDTFNPLSTSIGFHITGANLNTNVETITVLLNGIPLPVSQMQVTTNSVSVPASLLQGRNEISFFAGDTEGRQIYKNAIVWAGGYSFNAETVDENNNPVNGAKVSVLLGDDKNVKAVVNTVNGIANFNNLPNRTVIIEASDSLNRIASTALLGSEGFVQLKLKGFDPVSQIDNNDFSQGTSGWQIGTSPVQIVEHNEGVFIPIETNLTSAFSNSSADKNKQSNSAGSRAALNETLKRNAKPDNRFANTASVTGTDNDLVLNTSGEGAQTISRSFQAEEGVQEIKVRYKFITSEVPGGYFGTQYNDYFNVSIRTQNAAGSVSESQTMNNLGLSAFDASGATDWREITLPVNENGDIIQINASVANVADGLLDSLLIVDFVAKPKVKIQELEAVVKDKTANIEVKVTSNPPADVTLTLVTTGGTGNAVFASNNSATMTINQTTVVAVKGISESNTRDNIKIEARDGEGNKLDDETFSVLWVVMSVRPSGSVSNDNSAKSAINSAMGRNSLGTFLSSGTTTQAMWRNNIEIVGTVSPSNFQGKVKLVRWRIESRYYLGSVQQSGVGGGANDDTSLDDFRDDEPKPNGKVYDFDAPGVTFGSGTTAGTIRRQRANFREYAVYKDSVRTTEEKASDEINWFARISVSKTSGADVLSTDVAGDNVAGQGSTALTWNLQP